MTMEIQRSGHEAEIEKDAHGWHAVCAVCGWSRFSLRKDTIEMLVDRHFRDSRVGVPATETRGE